jgi:hypothetical protein
MPDREHHTDHPTRPPYFWLSVGAVIVALVIVGVRIITLPESSVQPFAIGLVAALALTVVIAAAFARAIAARMRGAAGAFPSALVIPIVVGPATAVATDWLATHLGDPPLRLPTSTYATIAIDADGMHVVRSPAGPYGFIAASAVRLGPLGRTMIGVRERDAIVLDVTVGTVTAPLAFVPMRLHGNPWRSLTDPELLEVVGRIETVLAGQAVTPGWRY